ncbi:MAG: DUF1343 domain-containing protein [Nitrospirota bacterium]|nr:DUF1343 domain-containing protein [Nitrospirota bacterium]
MKSLYRKTLQWFSGIIALALLLPMVSHSGESAERVMTGLDVLESGGFQELRGKWVGVITNHTGVNSSGRHIVDLLCNAPGVKMAAIFTPEHGFEGKLDEKVASGTDPASRLPVHSLYGTSQRPTNELLKGLDALVFDIQSVGVRFYTYITTMAYAMEEAAENGLDFYVLDRPNPVDASVVEGPVLDEGLQSFTAYFPMPVRHGMTMGELALMFNTEYKIGAKLHVIPMRGYQRDLDYDDTGLPWPAPSPNLRTLTQTKLYPGVALIESANVSVGRGTATPFELVGAPWIKKDELARYLSGQNLAGVKFVAEEFVPAENKYKNKVCQGVRIVIADDDALDPVVLGLELTAALYRLYPDQFLIDKTLPMFGSQEVLDAIQDCASTESIACVWEPQLERFKAMRAKYLLYP